VRVSGRWPLVSGCRHARWLYAQCIVSGEDTAAGGDGAARLRTVVLRAEQARILGSWRGLGLHGSGSDDIHLKDHFSPASHVCDLTSPPLTSTASNRVPVVVQAGLVAAAVLIGAGHAAIEAVTELAVVKRPSFSAARLADQTVFQDRLGEACSSLLAAHALLFEAVGEVDDAGPDGAEDEVRLNAVAPKAAGLAREAIETAYDLGGSSSATEGSPLQRRLRDARSLSQHAAISAELLSRLGALAVAAN
jgi:alkylation response protein AidB-like acyl-CoA dehydrogenase